MSKQFSDALTFIKGKHSLKLGATIIQRHISTIQADFNKGFYFFDDFTATPGKVPASGRTGYEVADMIIGRTAFTTTSVPGINPATTISYEDGFFVQDDWRVHRRVTINAGLRYDRLTPYREKNNHLANFDPASGKLVLAGVGGALETTVDTDTNNVGPPIGIAYALTDDGRTVLRGGLRHLLFAGSRRDCQPVDPEPAVYRHTVSLRVRVGHSCGYCFGRASSFERRNPLA